jgi:hypothetical protein
MAHDEEKALGTDASEGVLDDDATPADSDWAQFDEEEFLKGSKGGGSRDADDEDEEKEEDDDELDGFGFEDEEE